MTDLEMTRLCAEAMDLPHPFIEGDRVLYKNLSVQDFLEYEPLHDDAQVMALVKRFGIDLTSPVSVGGTWGASFSERDPTNELTGWKLVSDGDNADLNRAVVECVAKIQAAKVKP